MENKFIITYLDQQNDERREVYHNLDEAKNRLKELRSGFLDNTLVEMKTSCYEPDDSYDSFE